MSGIFSWLYNHSFALWLVWAVTDEMIRNERARREAKRRREIERFAREADEAARRRYPPPADMAGPHR